MQPKTVFGQLHGTQKTQFSLNKPARIVWNDSLGVFLTDKQEQLTINQLLLKEEFKGSYVAQYEINIHLEKKLLERDKLIEDYSRKLDNCESKIVNSVDNMILYKKKFEDSEAENKKLESKIKEYKFKLPLYKIGTIAFGIGTAYFGTMYLIHKLD